MQIQKLISQYHVADYEVSCFGLSSFFLDVGKLGNE